MSQHDYELENNSGVLFRQDINKAIRSLASNNSGPTYPAVTFPFMFYADENGGYMMQRSADDQSWHKIYRLGSNVIENDDYNFLINGQFRINQAGLAFDGPGYNSDMTLSFQTGDTVTTSIVSFAQDEQVMPNQPEKAIRQTLNSVAGGNDSLSILQIRADALFDLSGRDVTLSGWCVGNQNMSLAAEILQIFGVGGSSPVYGISVETIPVTTNWAYFEITGAIPSLTSKILGLNPFIGVHFWQSAGSDYNGRTNSIGAGQAGQFFQLANLKLQLGSSATVLGHRSLAESLADCQAYYENSWYPYALRTDDLSGASRARAQRASSFDPTLICNYLVQKRSKPSITAWSQSTDNIGTIRNINTGNHDSAQIFNVSCRGHQMRPEGIIPEGHEIMAHWEADSRI